MEDKKLERWANLLLDTGKRNNLINFKDTKGSSVEVLLPSAALLLGKTESSASFQVYEPLPSAEKLSREEYLEAHGTKLKKNGQILLYNEVNDPVSAVRSIHKRAKSALEETGVNVAYMVFGFIHWQGEGGEFRAPLLLAPVLFSNESAISPYYVRMTEDDVVVNPAFNFKLSSEYGITLPEYADEPLEEYLETVGSIAAKLGWSVSAECKIGIFSFLKLNMYQDLVQNAAVIRKNNNVRMLLGEPFDDPGDLLRSGAYHLTNPLIELHNVVDADSSQMEAIEMARAGISFVLQGPPGTGKSQTITNMIAECLSEGKKVLFVSEKQAALNVVYDKLKKAGLEEFCLELHSYKANKKDVIDELCRTLRAPVKNLSSRAEEEIGLKQRSQRTLDDYAAGLHLVQEPIHMSLYELYDAYARVAAAPDTGLLIRDIETLGAFHRDTAVELLERYGEAGAENGFDYRKNFWYGFVNTDTSYKNVRSISEAMGQLQEAVEELIPQAEAMSEELGISCNNLREVQIWDEFLKAAEDSRYLTEETLEVTEIDDLLACVRDLAERSADLLAMRSKLAADYDEDILKLDGVETHKRLERLYEKFFSRVFSSEYRNIITTIRVSHRIGWKPTYEDALQITDFLGIYQQKLAAFAAAEEPLRPVVSDSYRGVETDWQQLENELLSVKKIHTCLRGKYTFPRGLYTCLRGKYSFPGGKSAEAALEQLKDCFDPRLVDLRNLPLRQVAQKMTDCRENMDRLESWIHQWSLVLELRRNQLGAYLDAAIVRNLPADQYVNSYLRSFYYQWIDHVLHSTKGLTKFNRAAHDRAVDTFCRKDELQFAVSRAQIRAELSDDRPSLDMLFKGSAVSVLLREGEKKRKQKSIRRLFSEVGDLVQVLKPCFLMSPLSVSTFLDTEDIRFDVVIFDEASQIFPQDALGAIYRSDQLIVVGDSRQMPPSNFFQASVTTAEEDEEEDVADFESILDLCSTALPQLRLRWHYRSRYEQLIAFSNKNFYDGDLVTFPSPGRDKEGVGVDYLDAQGTFDHKSRTNRVEAECVVDRIFDHIDRYPDRSLGVVAFSISQQDLIERLLAERRKSDPSREDFFRPDAREPFFIKNLETVQGDERDTIIFSVAYARDEQGKLLHNFGPLNRAGGERRLNVAVTRARINVLLVASIHSSDIDPGRAHSEGARLLREYLAFAETGVIGSIARGNDPATPEAETSWEEDVAECLREAGYVVERGVGLSGFRVDMAVRRPEDENYILAVEFDGDTYRAARNARDRDRLRREILERMGWNYYRIWSTEWFKNRGEEKHRLLQAAEAACVEPEPVEPMEEETGFEETAEEQHVSFPVYLMADLQEICARQTKLAAVIREVVETEAPISEEWLRKRLCFRYGKTKVTSAMMAEFTAALEDPDNEDIARRGGFLYRRGVTDLEMRLPAGEEKRELRYIAPEELAAGMYRIMRQSITMSRDDLFAAVAKLLGYTRVGETMEAPLENALGLLDEVLTEKEDMLEFCDNL